MYQPSNRQVDPLRTGLVAPRARPLTLGAATAPLSRPASFQIADGVVVATGWDATSHFIKRGLDLVISAILLVVIAPLMGIIALLVAMDGGGALFGHKRVGYKLVPFRCLKFRTMIPGAEETLEEYLALNADAAAEWKCKQKLEFDVRVTPIGRILRRLSLDELPQLINVLRGEMSLVGPRPVTEQETSRYGTTLPFYASVRPGITGLWQVSGRSDVAFESRVAMDRQYVTNRSLLGDLTILFFATPHVLISRRGAK